MAQGPPITDRGSTPPATPRSPSSNTQAAAPPVSYAVELYFDPALENQVLKAWNALARRQLSSHLIEICARPHLPLLHLGPITTQHLDPLRLLPALRSLAARLDPVPLSLSCIGATSAAEPIGELFLSPTPTAALLGLHTQLCELLRKDGIEMPDAYRPDNWVPRCAVAVDVPKSRVAEAFCVLRELKLPVSGYAMDIGLVEFPTVREVFSFPLGGGAGVGGGAE